MKIPSNCRWQPTGTTIGQGRQGSVVEVTDKSGELDRKYALKRIGSGKPKAAYLRFAREIEAIKPIDHPGIVKVVDHAGPEDEFQFYVMELVEGARSLKQLLGTTDNPFHGDALESLRFFIAVLSALSECERLNIVHRDLSPSNVLIAGNEIKIIDFGLCQIADDRTITLVDEGAGTPNYMAPECESGASGNILTAADLYSTGKLLWSAITNQVAFSREEAAYKGKSMKTMFPTQPMTWHLHHVFAGTIRHKIGDRFPNATNAIQIAEHVAWLISTGKPPLQQFGERPVCPLCGWGMLERMQDDWQVFHNPMPSGYSGRRCTNCGVCFPVHNNTIRENLAKMNDLL